MKTRTGGRAVDRLITRQPQEKHFARNVYRTKMSYLSVWPCICSFGAEHDANPCPTSGHIMSQYLDDPTVANADTFWTFSSCSYIQIVNHFAAMAYVLLISMLFKTVKYIVYATRDNIAFHYHPWNKSLSYHKQISSIVLLPDVLIIRNHYYILDTIIQQQRWPKLFSDQWNNGRGF